MALIDLRKEPTPTEARWFGLLFLCFFALLAGVLWWRGAPGAARSLAFVGGAGSLLYYAIPPLRRPFFALWMTAAYPIGWLISHVMLAIVYYAVITPIGLGLRIFGADPLGRRGRDRPATYWTRRPPAAGPDQYFRQF